MNQRRVAEILDATLKLNERSSVCHEPRAVDGDPASTILVAIRHYPRKLSRTIGIDESAKSSTRRADYLLQAEELRILWVLLKGLIEQGTSLDDPRFPDHCPNVCGRGIGGR